MTLGMFFIQNLFEPDGRFYYVAVVLTVIISIVVHELAHGLAALYFGDDTPRLAGHITLNPIVHMGGFSLVFLFLVGIAWGQMPVNPSRMRGRHAHAYVALAGPLSNIVLALLALTALGLWRRYFPAVDPTLMHDNARLAIYLFGVTNIVLCFFNLVPVPPLDGSTILASLDRRYADLVADPSKQGLFMLGFALFFLFSGFLFDWAGRMASNYIRWIVYL